MVDWNRTSPAAWARLVGMIPVPLFDRKRRQIVPGNHSVLLDGPNASIALSIGDAPTLLADDAPLSWVWSANLTHSVVIDEGSEKSFVRRWDNPGMVREGPIANEREAITLVESLATAPQPIAKTVIEKMLVVFRRVRNNIDERGGTDKDTIRAFNTLLIWAHAIQEGEIDPDLEGHPSTLREVLPILAKRRLIKIRAESLSPSVQQFPIADLLDAITARDPSTNLVLDPDLFIRHAAGVLYQEAHRELDRKVVNHPRQLVLFEDVNLDDTPARGAQQRDVHFTPPSLARTLLQEAIQEITEIRELPETLKILDPACGSGVFLVEALREIASEGKNTDIVLKGFDRSPIACIMTKFCVTNTADDEGNFGRKSRIYLNDSLKSDVSWGKPDIILMNPPFIPWNRMSAANKANVNLILKKTPGRLPDMSFAFLAKAVKSLKAGAALATVIPASFLNSDAAERLRESILADRTLSIRFIGRFRSLDFFSGATVEPALLVIARLLGKRKGRFRSTRCLIAESGHEDEALRALRRNDRSGSLSSNGWEIYDQSEESLTSANWLPIAQQPAALFESMRSAGTPRVSDIFDVRLNVQTGDKTAFIINKRDIDNYSSDPSFASSFLPVADEIRDGQILSSSIVFYPYDKSGSDLFASEDELRRLLPKFYIDRLLPNKKRLSDRPAVKEKPWWSLNRPRGSWAVGVPKLVTPQFGGNGTFAFDEFGHFVVIQGNAWFPKAQNFVTDRLPMAYLAILNSPIFEAILNTLCPRVQGGQYNLNTKYIGVIPIPNFFDEFKVGVNLIDQLAMLGRSIAEGQTPRDDSLDLSTAKAYGLPLSRLRASLLPGYTEQVTATFRDLAERWKRETRFVSSITDIVGNPNYQKIIAIGEDAIPLILSEIERKAGHWFYALHLITSQDPVAEDDRGDVRRMASSWLQWGSENGYR